ncbi:MAG: site-2 protease family protein [Pseudohongiellaceae bacterium]
MGNEMQQRRPAGDRRSGIELGTLFGITVVLDWSLLIIAFLVAAAVALGPMAQWHEDWSTGLRWLVGAGAAVLLFASILVHEFSHALMARRFGTPVQRITLFIFGGMAHMEEEARHWRAELLIALVGPVTSLVLGFLLLSASGLLFDPEQLLGNDPEQILGSLGPLASLLLWAGNINIILAVFNMVPAYPLDGGRVLCGLLWGFTGDKALATRWSAFGGRLFGSLLMALGIAMVLGIQIPFFGTGFVGGLWLVFIGWFLSRAALLSYQSEAARGALAKVRVGDIMRREFDTLAPALGLDEVVEQHLLARGTRAWPVLENERLLGLLTFDDLRRVGREQWPSTQVREIMVDSAALVTIGPDEAGFQALAALSQHAINQMPVLDNGRLVGMVHREDILRWLELYGRQQLAA